MITDKKTIINWALNARTLEQANAVQELIASAIGARYQRPLGNTENNLGLLTSGGNFDHTILELVTNMQDAVLELWAIRKHGSREGLPYRTPHEAGSLLFAGLTRKQKARLVSTTIDKATATHKKEITVVMRDYGCGIRPEDVPDSIFRIGSGHKDGYNWQQGTFGLGGTTTYRNADAVVLVTRRQPELLRPGEVDQITVAVVQWERPRTTTNAYYLVMKPWRERDKANWDKAVPFSVPASDYRGFKPGTHLALISYKTTGLGVRSGDERSFDTVFNTRLYKPLLPLKYRNNIIRDRDEFLSGLEKRLNDKSGPSNTDGKDTLPFKYEGVTYQLPVRYRLFAKRGETGDRRSFVAKNHALLVTSNGQVHSHWSPLQFKNRTRLNKLYNRVLVIVKSDALPLDARTELFTPDRVRLVSSATALRLEKEIAEFLNQWPALVDINNSLIREAITGGHSNRPTLDVARKIARAFKAKGFNSGGGRGKGGGVKPSPPTPKEDLYNDPTHFEGPESVEAEIGRPKSIYYKLNAKDGFLDDGGRGQLLVSCDHPDISQDDITIGKLSSGRVRVSVAVSDNADYGTYRIDAEVPEWLKKSGGLGPRFEWTTKLTIVEEFKPRSPTPSGPDQGSLVALIWRSEEDGSMDEWTSATVGEVQTVLGSVLASERDEYKHLAAVDSEIPTIFLNLTYSYLKKYIQARAAQLTDEGTERARERYAVGVGVALLILEREIERARKSGEGLNEPTLFAARQAAARAVLANMPEYDRLVRELET